MVKCWGPILRVGPKLNSFFNGLLQVCTSTPKDSLGRSERIYSGVVWNSGFMNQYSGEKYKTTKWLEELQMADQIEVAKKNWSCCYSTEKSLHTKLLRPCRDTVTQFRHSQSEHQHQWIPVIPVRAQMITCRPHYKLRSVTSEISRTSTYVLYMCPDRDFWRLKNCWKTLQLIDNHRKLVLIIAIAPNPTALITRRRRRKRRKELRLL